MGKKKNNSIDTLFGSKTRVKLLHLFLNNPSKSFYVREITRLIDEQINSVRRELANLLEVGVITSDNADNKLYYQVNDTYEFYTPFRAIFSDEMIVAKSNAVRGEEKDATWRKAIQSLSGVKVAIAAGILVQGSAAKIDLLLVGSSPKTKVKQVVDAIQKAEGRDINFTQLSYDEFYYRLSVRDRFVMEMLSSKYDVIVDKESILSEYTERS